MCIQFPPPREPNAEAFQHDFLAYLVAFAKWHLIGASEHDARAFLKMETERLHALDRARADGLILRG